MEIGLIGLALTRGTGCPTCGDIKPCGPWATIFSFDVLLSFLSLDAKKRRRLKPSISFQSAVESFCPISGISWLDRMSIAATAGCYRGEVPCPLGKRQQKSTSGRGIAFGRRVSRWILRSTVYKDYRFSSTSPSSVPFFKIDYQNNGIILSYRWLIVLRSYFQFVM